MWQICVLKILTGKQIKSVSIRLRQKKQIELPLLKDVGESIIEYMKYGRPTCNSDHIFVRHRDLYMNLQHLLSALLSTGIF